MDFDILNLYEKLMVRTHIFTIFYTAVSITMSVVFNQCMGNDGLNSYTISGGLKLPIFSFAMELS